MKSNRRTSNNELQNSSAVATYSNGGSAPVGSGNGTYDRAAPVASARPSAEDISRRAYALWQSEGGVHGQDQQYWFRAEQELSAKRSG